MQALLSPMHQAWRCLEGVLHSCANPITKLLVKAEAVLPV